MKDEILYPCDSGKCQNAVDITEIANQIDIAKMQSAAKEVEDKVMRWGWQNIDGKLYCKFCAMKIKI